MDNKEEDLDLLDKLEADEVLAASVISVGNEWYKQGRKDGFDAGYTARKVEDSFMLPVLAFVLGGFVVTVIALFI